MLFRTVWMHSLTPSYQSHAFVMKGRIRRSVLVARSHDYATHNRKHYKGSQSCFAFIEGRGK